MKTTNSKMKMKQTALPDVATPKVVHIKSAKALAATLSQNILLETTNLEDRIFPAKKELRVLIVEDSEDDLFLLLQEIKRGGFDPIFRQVETREEMESMLENHTWDIVLSDYSLPQFDAPSAHQILMEKNLDLPFILVSGRLGEEAAVEAIKAGIQDYIPKDSLSRVGPVIHQGLREAEIRRQRNGALQALDQSEQRFRGLVEGSIQGTLVHQNSIILFVNQSLADILGYDSPEEMLHRSLHDIRISTNGNGGQEEPHSLPVAASTAGRSEESWWRRDGRVTMVEVFTTQISWDGSPATQINLMDINARVSALRQLENSKALLQTVLDTIPHNVFAKNLDGTYAMVNRTLARFEKKEPKDAVGQPPNPDTYSDETIRAFSEMDRKVFENGMRMEIPSFEIELADGSTEFRRIQKMPLRSENGAIIGVVGMSENISELVKANRDLKEKIRELEDTTHTFRRFVPDQLQKRIATGGIKTITPNSSEKGEATILFSDVRSFATLAENMDSTETLTFLNNLLVPIIPMIHTRGGFICDFAGDEIMAIFYEQDSPDADNAVRTALDMRKYINEKKYQGLLVPAGVDMGIGLNSGSITTGIIGNESRMHAAVSGDAVVLASRVQNLTKFYSQNVLVTSFTVQKLLNPNDYNFRLIDFVRVQGKKNPVEIYEFFDSDPAPIKENKLRVKKDFVNALTLFRCGEWGEAEQLFNDCKNHLPDDPVISLYLGRCASYRAAPPETSWRGVENMKKHD